jgi:expansin (peptidoglycan-binding protein)
VKATEQAAGQPGRHGRRGGQRLLVVSASAVVLLVIALVAVLLPDHKANAGFTAAAPASSATLAAPTASQSSVATPSASATPSPSASSAAPKPSTPSSTHAVSSAASLAGRIQPGTTYQGVATEYSAADGNGACLFGPAADMMIGAMNETDYETAKACGDYIQVRASNGASITVLITNECPLPCAPGQIDLSQQAFAKLANPSAGRIPITWKLVSPSLSNAISIRYKTGSSQYWCGIQVIGHRNPVATLEVRAGGAWRQLPRTSYNYFLAADGRGCGGQIRVTDIYGQQLVISGITISPDLVQPTGVQFAQH